MVEGGASVIAGLLAHSPGVVDIVIITVAPVWVGPEGVGIGQGGVSLGNLRRGRGSLTGDRL